MSPPQRDLPGCGGVLGPREKELGSTVGDPLPREQMGDESVGIYPSASAQRQTSWLQLQECWHRDWDQDGIGMGMRTGMGCIGE